MWNFSITILLSQFSPLLLSSLINLYDVRYIELKIFQMRFKSHEKASVASAYFSVIILIALAASLSLLILNIRRIARNPNDESISLFKTRFSVMNESLKESKHSSLIFYWKTLILFRWLVTLIILVILRSEPIYQIGLLLSLSLIQQCLIAKAYPYETKKLNLLVFFNEMATSMYLYLTFLLTDYLET